LLLIQIKSRDRFGATFTKRAAKSRFRASHSVMDSSPEILGPGNKPHVLRAEETKENVGPPARRTASRTGFRGFPPYSHDRHGAPK
jgi:hypothetical protein